MREIKGVQLALIAEYIHLWQSQPYRHMNMVYISPEHQRKLTIITLRKYKADKKKNEKI